MSFWRFTSVSILKGELLPTINRELQIKGSTILQPKRLFPPTDTDKRLCLMRRH